MPPRPGPSTTYQIDFGAVEGLAAATEQLGRVYDAAASGLAPLFEEIEQGVRLPGSRGVSRPTPAPPLAALRDTIQRLNNVASDIRQHKITIAGWDREAHRLFARTGEMGLENGFTSDGYRHTSLFELMVGRHAEFPESRNIVWALGDDGHKGPLPIWLLDFHKEADDALDVGSGFIEHLEKSKGVKDPHTVASIMGASPVVIAMRLAGRSEGEIYEVVHQAHNLHAGMWFKEGGEFGVGVMGGLSQQGYQAFVNARTANEFFGNLSHGGLLHRAHHIGESIAPEAHVAARFPNAAPVAGRVLPGVGTAVGLTLAPEQAGYLLDGRWRARDIEAAAGLTSTGVAAYMLLTGATGPAGWVVGGVAAGVGLAAHHFGDHSEEKAAKQLKTDVHDLLAGHIAGGDGGGHGGGH